MEYVKKKFVDEENRIISWFSTDDNILCNDGKTLREKVDELSKNISSGGTVTVDGCNITYISPSSLDEFIELTKEGGLFYLLTTVPIVYKNTTYNVVGFIDSRPHNNGYSYYAFHKMWQFLINPDTKAVTSFSSLSEFLQKKIPSDASKLSIKDVNNNFTSTNVEGALEEVATQCKNIPIKTAVENNKLYLIKKDGTKIDTGTTLPSNTNKDTLVTTNVLGTTLSLTKDKYQTATVSDGIEITLPTVTSFTEIHLFFSTTTDLTLILPSCKWQNGNTPTISANKTYEFIFTYTTEWLGGVIVYE